MPRAAPFFLTLLFLLMGWFPAAACESSVVTDPRGHTSFHAWPVVCDRLTSDTYDANGNTTSSLLTSHSALGTPTNAADIYSFDNRLIRRTHSNGLTIDLTYNPDGHRLTKLVSGGGLTQRVHHYLTDPNNPTGYSQDVEEKDPLAPAAEQLKKVHLYGHDLVATEQRASASSLESWVLQSSVSFYSYDGLGSVRGITDESGELQETYDYDAYGTLIGLAKRNATTGELEPADLTSSDSALRTPTSEFLFTGEQWDADLGMYFLRARYLNTNTGRFHTQDTYEGRTGEPLTLHKYLYVHGNPVMGTDPSGNLVEDDPFTAPNGRMVHGLFAMWAIRMRGIMFFHDTRLGNIYRDIDHSHANLRPDIVDVARSRWFELKTIKHKSSPYLAQQTSNGQLEEYRLALAGRANPGDARSLVPKDEYIGDVFDFLTQRSLEVWITAGNAISHGADTRGLVHYYFKTGRKRIDTKEVVLILAAANASGATFSAGATSGAMAATASKATAAAINGQYVSAAMAKSSLETARNQAMTTHTATRGLF